MRKFQVTPPTQDWDEIVAFVGQHSTGDNFITRNGANIIVEVDGDFTAPDAVEITEGVA